MSIYYTIPTQAFNSIYFTISGMVFHSKIDSNNTLVKLPLGMTWTKDVVLILNKQALNYNYISLLNN